MLSKKIKQEKKKATENEIN